VAQTNQALMEKLFGSIADGTDGRGCACLRSHLDGDLPPGATCFVIGRRGCGALNSIVSPDGDAIRHLSARRSQSAGCELLERSLLTVVQSTSLISVLPELVKLPPHFRRLLIRYRAKPGILKRLDSGSAIAFAKDKYLDRFTSSFRSRAVGPSSSARGKYQF
jgi:hypothetical protein